MTFSKAVKAASKAILYFFVYYACIMAVTFGAMFYVSFDAVSNIDLFAELGISPQDMADMTPELFSAITNVLAQRTLPAYVDFVTEYAIHLTLLAGVLAVAVYIIIFAFRKKSFKDKIGLRRIGLMNGVAAFIFGASLNVFLSVLLSVLPFPEEWLSEYTTYADELTGGTGVIMVLLVGVLAPVFEEIIFRGVCYNSLKSGMPMLAAMILSSWGFGMMHAGALWVVYATVMGIILTWIYEKNNSLLAPILTHVGFNLIGKAIEYMPEQSDMVHYVMMAVSGLICAATVYYTVKTSKYRIQYTMSKTEDNESFPDGGDKGETK